jgi:two-component system, NarL family, nitrate/nitrite response regulator NarL
MDATLAPLDRQSALIGAAQLRILFVSDVQSVRDAIAGVLERHPSIAVVRCGDPIETMVLDLTTQVDAILVHTELEDAAGVARRLRAAAPHLPIIAFPLRETSEQVIAWAAAGATGYIPVTVPLDRIVGVLQDILRGEQICSARVAASLLRRITATNSVDFAEPTAVRPLTRRERQVAELVASRLDDKEIAQYLNIGLATAKTHVHNLLRKLDVRRRRDVAEALRGQPEALSGGPVPVGPAILRQ